MTRKLWHKICEFFLSNQKKEKEENGKRINLTFDGNSSHSLQGIIRYLTDKFGGNVNEKGIVNVTASSINTNNNYAVDLSSDSIFQTRNMPNQWLKYDFKERRICPTHYTIRTRNDGCNSCNPQNWVIEGSNDINDWQLLDSRKNDTNVQKANQIATFNIMNQLQPDKSFRYIRIRQTGKSSNNSDYLTLTALEYFGTLIEQ